MPEQPTSKYRSHPAALTADRILRHRKTYTAKLTDAEQKLLFDAATLLRQIAYHR